MLKKSLSLVGLLLAPALLAGCPVYVDTYGSYDPYYGSPDVVVVGESVPSYIEYGKPTYRSKENGRNPVITSFTPTTTQVKAGQPISFTVVAQDPDDQPMQYNWASTGGTLSGNSGRVVSWDPPEEPGTYTITVIVSNARGGAVTGSLNLTLKGAGTTTTATPLPPAATPSPTPTTAPTPVPTSVPTAMPTSMPTPTAMPSATPVPTTAQDPEKSSIAGTVFDDANPLEGVEVEISTPESSTVKFGAKAITGADGRYHFANVPAGVKFFIAATKAGYGEKIRTITTLKGQETTWDFAGTFSLARN